MITNVNTRNIFKLIFFVLLVDSFLRAKTPNNKVAEQPATTDDIVYEKQIIYEKQKICPKNTIKLNTEIMQVIDDNGALAVNTEQSGNYGDVVYIKKKGFFKNKADADPLDITVKRDGAYKYETMKKGYFKTVAAFGVVECKVQKIKREEIVEKKKNPPKEVKRNITRFFAIFTILLFVFLSLS